MDMLPWRLRFYFILRRCWGGLGGEWAGTSCCLGRGEVAGGFDVCNMCN